MPRNEKWIDICPTKFAPHESRRRAPPDRVFNIYDRGHQRNETKIPLNHRHKGANPSAITCSEQTEFFAPALTQCRHQLSRLDYPLTETLRVANEIGSDREFTVPVPARDPRIMIREVHEAGVPTEFVEARSITTISDVARRHKRVEH